MGILYLFSFDQDAVPTNDVFIYCSTPSQLEEQRKYYEERLVESGSDNHKRVVHALEKEKKSLEKRNTLLTSRVARLDEELKFVRCVV